MTSSTHDSASAPVESLWYEAGHGEDAPTLSEDIDVDVAIVGAGYTGLWTAWYLATQAPDARIAIVESRTAGAGASGRNGGWCVAELAGLGTHLEQGLPGADTLRAHGRRHLFRTLQTDRLAVPDRAAADLAVGGIVVRIGPVIGWPMLLGLSLIISNVWAYRAGEWSNAKKPLRIMIMGLAIIIFACIILGYSNSLM